MIGIRQGYGGFGLLIDSTIPIPGAVPVQAAERGTAQADIVIDLGSTAMTQVEAVSGPYSRSGAALLLDVPGVGRYLAASPSQLTIEPADGSDPEDVAALLVATALPMLLWMRGAIVLHAAGVILLGSDAVLAIAGPSGTGKSTLAHRLVAAGARFVGDDSLAVTIRDLAPEASGLPACCFLPDPGGEGRHAHPVPASQQIASAWLGAIILLERCAPDAASPPEELRGTAALEALLRNRHRPRAAAIMGREAEIFPRVAALSRAVPIHRLTIPEGNPAEAEVRLRAVAAEAFRPKGTHDA